MLAVAVTVLTTVILFWHTATMAWSQRAVQELGAERILVVQAGGAAHLLSAVRTVDPDGRYAMAVARTEGVATGEPGRRRGQLPDGPGAALAGRRREAAALAARLRPTAPAPPLVVDGPLSLDATGPVGLESDESVDLRLHLVTVDGAARQIDFAGLMPGRRTLETTVAGCAGSCRLVSLEIVAPVVINRHRPATVEIYGLTQIVR